MNALLHGKIGCRSRTSAAARFIPLLGVLCVMVLAAYAWAGEQAVTHRVTGLFAPSREADLRVALEAVPGVKLVRLDFKNAEGIFLYDPAIAFNDTKSEKIVERFDNLLRSASNHTMGIMPLNETAKDKLADVVIPVAGLDCKACCLAAYEAIYRIDGVVQATASFRDGRVTARIDPGKTDRMALEAALKRKNVTLKDSEKPAN